MGIRENVDKLPQSRWKGVSLEERERNLVLRQLREYLYRVRQVFSHHYSSDLPRRWWPAFILLDDMQSHLPFLIDWLETGSPAEDNPAELEWPESLIEFEERTGRPIRAPRAFSAEEKRELWFRARGRCCICHVALTQGWHADHIIPWKEGGPTTIDNGQALCRPCNLRKSARTFEEEGP